jgi:hypothetical protein
LTPSRSKASPSITLTPEVLVPVETHSINFGKIGVSRDPGDE